MISFVLANKEPDQPTTVSGDLLGILKILKSGRNVGNI